MGNVASSQLSARTPRLRSLGCAGSISSHLLFPGGQRLREPQLGPRQTSACGWDHGGAHGDHLGCPYPRRREQGREWISPGLLPSTSPGQLVHAAMEDTGNGDVQLTWEHPNCSGDTPLAQRAVKREGDNARGLRGLSPQMRPPPSYL